jgi:hypothetical protein
MGVMVISYAPPLAFADESVNEQVTNALADSRPLSGIK